MVAQGRRRPRSGEQVVLRRATVKVPEQVLVRAERAVDGKRPAAPEPAREKKLLAREKVVAALKKLHPMD